MKLPLYFISDTHIGMQINESEIKRRNRLYKLFDNIKLTGGTLIIGGDFFDFWFEFGKKAPKIYSDVFEELESLKQHGIDIHYVAGNHDYWNFGYFESTFLKSFYKDDFSINKFGFKNSSYTRRRFIKK